MKTSFAVSSRVRHIVGALVVLGAAAAGVLVACDIAPIPEPDVCKSGAACEADAAADASEVDSTCATYAAAYCDQITRCFAQSKARRLPPDQCAARQMLACQLRLTAPGSMETREGIEQCALDRQSFSCDDMFAGKAPDSCKLVAGTLDDGAPCVDDAQCKNRVCQFTNTSGACGACVKLPGEGEDCSLSGDCEAPFFCMGNKCASLVPSQEPCSPERACAQTLSCVAGTCVKALAAGSACTVTNGIEPCDNANDIHCDPAIHLCAQEPYAPLGASCGIVDGKSIHCAGGAVCAQQASGVGTCVAPAADGAPCDSVKGPYCLEPAVCRAGVCKLRDPSACK
jgi:hypothetical protein